MLKDVGIEVPKSIETRSKFSMHADKGIGGGTTGAQGARAPLKLSASGASTRVNDQFTDRSLFGRLF